MSPREAFDKIKEGVNADWLMGASVGGGGDHF